MLGSSKYPYNLALEGKGVSLLGNGCRPSTHPGSRTSNGSTTGPRCELPFRCSSCSPNSTLSSVKNRLHRISLSIHHHSPAYLDENYPITIEVTNADIKNLEVVLDVLLQPTDVDGAGKPSVYPLALSPAERLFQLIKLLSIPKNPQA